MLEGSSPNAARKSMIAALNFFMFANLFSLSMRSCELHKFRLVIRNVRNEVFGCENLRASTGDIPFNALRVDLDRL